MAIYIYTYICTRTRLPENQLSLVMHSLSQSHISCCHCQCIKCRLKMLECAELPSKRLIVCQLKVLKMKKDGEEPRNKKKNKKNKSEPSKHWNLIEISISYGHNGKKHLPNGFIRTANLQHLQLAFHWHKYILAGLNLIWINMYVCARWWFHIRMLTSFFVAHSYLCIHMCTYLSHTHTHKHLWPNVGNKQKHWNVQWHCRWKNIWVCKCESEIQFLCSHMALINHNHFQQKFCQQNTYIFMVSVYTPTHIIYIKHAYKVAIVELGILFTGWIAKLYLCTK